MLIPFDFEYAREAVELKLNKTDNFFIGMIIDFDKEIAKEAVELKTGRITTREGFQVQIEDWGFDDRSGFPIVGVTRLPIWAKGKCRDMLCHWDIDKLDLFIYAKEEEEI